MGSMERGLLTGITAGLWRTEELIFSSPFASGEPDHGQGEQSPWSPPVPLGAKAGCEDVCFS